MEGWVIGKNKVLLKYYNEEYLARLYETQVKKVVKIQCMIRAFVAKKKITQKLQERDGMYFLVTNKYVVNFRFSLWLWCTVGVSKY